jgi:putative FmdB family regulatory protein
MVTTQLARATEVPDEVDIIASVGAKIPSATARKLAGYNWHSRVTSAKLEIVMPTYEYACKSCGENLEVVQSFTDDALTVCPRCGGELRKVFGNVGIAFKGSGFYKNDSRTKSTSAKAVADASPSEGSTEKPSPSSGDEKSTTKEKTSTSSETATPSVTPAAAPAAPATKS